MAEQILFSLAEKIVFKLGSYAVKHVKLAWGAGEELQKLESTMCLVRNILLDAEEKQELNRAVKEWLPRLKDILYEADDLVDQFSTEMLRREVEIHGSKRKEVRNFFSSSNRIKFSHEIGRRVKDIRQQLEEVLADMKQFDFVVQAVENKPSPRGRDETYSFVCKAEVIGRDGDADSIVETLLESGEEETISVLPIVGLGGLGKTTLAQLVYNDERVDSHFQCRVWICVSDDFDVKKIIVKVLQALGDRNCDRLGLEPLQRQLQDKLNGVRFFLVLDDVWNEDRVEWIKLRDLLAVGDVESRVLVTTRSKTVASIMGTVPSYDLRGLSDDDCLTIFNKWAFNDGAERRHQNLVNIGKEIVKRCHGVPLAARTLGGLLYMKTEEREWLSVRDNELWATVQKENDIIPVLKLSYDQLPSYLKQCFAYCSLFRKNTRIEKWLLIYLWMAQGFIRPSEGNEQLEDIGECYISELVKRSFLEEIIQDPNQELLQGPNQDFYVMHDLVHDLSQLVAGYECFKLDSCVKAIPERLRHVSLDLSSHDPEPLLKSKRLRTFLGFNSQLFKETNPKLGQAVTSSFRYLRVLKLSGIKVEIPSSIGDLKLLRSLLIEAACGITVPETIGNLVNLQYLQLLIRWFPEDLRIFELPKSIGKLVNLRYLYLASTYLACLPQEICGLVSLQRMKISIAFQLQSLSEGFQFLSSLRYLEIYGCPLLKSLPTGMRNLSALEELYISSCEELFLWFDNLEGLTSLKKLTLYNLPKITCLPQGLQQSAASLEKIRIVLCPNLRKLSECIEYLTSLQKLEICECRSLLSLPDGMERLTNLKSLTISGCPDLSARCMSGTGPDFYKVEYIQEVVTDFERSICIRF